jgi:hypothetical protein
MASTIEYGLLKTNFIGLVTGTPIGEVSKSPTICKLHQTYSALFSILVVYLNFSGLIVSIVFYQIIKIIKIDFLSFLNELRKSSLHLNMIIRFKDMPNGPVKSDQISPFQYFLFEIITFFNQLYNMYTIYMCRRNKTTLKLDSYTCVS